MPKHHRPQQPRRRQLKGPETTLTLSTGVSIQVRQVPLSAKAHVIKSFMRLNARALTSYDVVMALRALDRFISCDVDDTTVLRAKLQNFGLALLPPSDDRLIYIGLQLRQYDDLLNLFKIALPDMKEQIDRTAAAYRVVHTE